MKRGPLVLTAAFLTAGAVAILPPPRPTVHRVHLPALVSVPSWMLATALPTRTATPLPPTTPSGPVLRPANPDQLKKAARVVGAHVIPAPGAYRMASVVQVAAGVTIDGRGQVTILDRGIYLYKADGVTLRGLTIREPHGDGININASTGTLIEDVTVRGPVGDGGLDIVHSRPGGGSHVLRRVTIRGVTKALLAGHQDDPNDNQLRVLLDQVVFENCQVRVPKSHRAQITIIGGTVIRWSGPRLDCQMGCVVTMKGTSWIAGKDSLPGYFTPTGGQVIDGGGNTLRPFKGAQ